MKLFLLTTLNGLTLSALYFLVACGFSLIFGLMRNVNLAHGSIYLLGAYIGYQTQALTESWYLSIIAGFVSMALLGVFLQYGLFRFLEKQELRQTLITIALSIIAADLMLAYWGGEVYQFEIPDFLYGAIKGIPIIKAYPIYRLFVLAVAVVVGILLWLFLNKTKIGMMIRAGVDDIDMLAASGVNVHLIFAITFGIGAGLAGLAGVIGGSALSIAPGEDTRYLLASLVVVIVGGMGSLTGSALGAILIGLAEQYGLVYTPTYGVVYTFVIMVLVLAVRPQGIVKNIQSVKGAS